MIWPLWTPDNSNWNIYIYLFIFVFCLPMDLFPFITSTKEFILCIFRSSYSCSCFEGFKDDDCGSGPLCANDEEFCKNGGICKYVREQLTDQFNLFKRSPKWPQPLCVCMSAADESVCREGSCLFCCYIYSLSFTLSIFLFLNALTKIQANGRFRCHVCLPRWLFWG